MRCIIVGDGPSAQGFVPPAGVTIIAVKRTIRWLPRADLWFSLDDNADSLHLMRNRSEGVRYFCASDRPEILPAGVTHLERVKMKPGTREPLPQMTPQWWMWRWSAVRGLSREPGKIHTGNSAYGALGLAYLMGFSHVLLVGVDGTNDRRLSDGGRTNNLSHLPMLFESALNQIDVRTVGTLGRVPHIKLADWLAETCTH